MGFGVANAANPDRPKLGRARKRRLYPILQSLGGNSSVANGKTDRK